MATTPNTEAAVSPSVAAFLTSDRAALIGGEWVDARDGATLDVRNPATGEVIARVAHAGPADVDAAVGAARRALETPPWRGLPPSERAKLLWRLADAIEDHVDELTELEVLNEGMPRRIAEILVGSTPETLRYYSGWCTKIEGKTVALSVPDERGETSLGPPYHAYSVREPIGVVAAIVPWNVPLVMAVAKLAPALAAGCTIVVKPAEETPLTALRLGELAAESGFPPGVVNVVPGDGEITGAALAAHPDVDKIAFTGSVEVGKRIVAAAAGNLKKVSLELGGKAPVLVLDDADLERAIPAAAEAIYLNSGQMCFAGSRLFVERSRFDEVVAGVADIARSMRIGAGLVAESDLGPLISSRQLDRVLEYVGVGAAEGAETVCGGARLGDRGFFMEPTVLASEDAGLRVSTEEIFGPVLVVHPFDDLAEVVREANATRYGLAASIWTRDVARAHAIAAELKAGVVWVNCHTVLDEAMPFGGYRESGWGREGGIDGVLEYTETKSVVVELSS